MINKITVRMVTVAKEAEVEQRELTEEQHLINYALCRFTTHMSERLMAKAEEGMRGWDDPEFGAQIARDLQNDMNDALQHGKIEKLLDLANRAMMLWWHKRNIDFPVA